MGATLTESEVSLLFLDGSRYLLKFTSELVSQMPPEPTADDLRKYIFDNWSTIWSEREGSVDSVSSAELIECNQIQILHLGTRVVDTPLADLNFELSPVLHIVVKPYDFYLSSVSAAPKKFDIKSIIGQRRRSSSGAGMNPNPNPNTPRRGSAQPDAISELAPQRQDDTDLQIQSAAPTQRQDSRGKIPQSTSSNASEDNQRRETKSGCCIIM